MDKELVTKLANNVWEVAKQLELGNFKQISELKTISSCLHDIRTDSDTEWYLKRGK